MKSQNNIMKNKELKTLLKVSKLYLIAGSTLWIIETIAFLLIQGWHLKATHPIEILLDEAVYNMFNLSFLLILFISLNYILNLNKKI